MTATARRTSPHDATVSAVGGALGWSIFTRIFQQVLSLLGSVLVVRWLGADDYGMLTVLRTSLAFVTTIAGLGLGQAILRSFPTARARGDVATAARLVRMTLLFQIGTWLTLLMIVFAASGWPMTQRREDGVVYVTLALDADPDSESGASRGKSLMSQ